MLIICDLFNSHALFIYKSVVITLNKSHIISTDEDPGLIKAHIHSENFPQKENFVQFDWLTQIFCRKKKFEVENFPLLTMIFSENFHSMENFLEWK